ncbi:MAG: hypothetical protein IJO52_04595 [Clostridia bacterium]|nr:hypothetical protein [Clostridia bacterium]
MLFCSASAIAVLLMVCGMLIYRLGVSDGVTMRKNENAASLFSKEKKKQKEEEEWRSIISYDHKN